MPQRRIPMYRANLIKKVSGRPPWILGTLLAPPTGTTAQRHAPTSMLEAR